MKQIDTLLAKDTPGKGQVAELKGPTIVAHLATLSGFPKKECKVLWEMVINGEEDAWKVFDQAETPAADQKKINKSYGVLQGALEFHLKESERREKQAEKEKADQQKAGEKLALSMQQGRQIAEKSVGDGIRESLQMVVGKKFVVGEMGLTMAEGATPLTREDIGKAVSGLFQTRDILDKAGSVNKFALGDALDAAEGILGGDIDDLIAQAAAVSGKDKKEIQEALRVCKQFKHKDRVSGLFFTHYEEAYRFNNTTGKNANPRCTVSQAVAILKKAAKGEQVVGLRAPDGREIQQWRPWSCAKTRAAFEEEYGEKKAEEAPPAETPEVESEEVQEESQPINLGYLYVFEDGTVLESEFEQKEFIANCVAALDLTARITLIIGEDGEPCEGTAFRKVDEKPKKKDKAKKKAESDLPEV